MTVRTPPHDDFDVTRARLLASSFAITITIGMIVEASIPATTMFRCTMTGELMRECCCVGDTTPVTRGTCAVVGAPGCCDIVTRGLVPSTTDRVAPQVLAPPSACALPLPPCAFATAEGPPRAAALFGSPPPEAGPLETALTTLRI